MYEEVQKAPRWRGCGEWQSVCTWALYRRRRRLDRKSKCSNVLLPPPLAVVSNGADKGDVLALILLHRAAEMVPASSRGLVALDLILGDAHLGPVRHGLGLAVAHLGRRTVLW